MGYLRKHEDNRRLKRLAENGRSWCEGAYYCERKHRYLRAYPYSKNHGCNLRKYWTNISNRKLRRSPETLQGCAHKKIFDLWWTLY